jgi:POT family proton-dependent oligopeptide transporter
VNLLHPIIDPALSSELSENHAEKDLNHLNHLNPSAQKESETLHKNRRNSIILLLMVVLLTAAIASSLSILTLTFQKVFGFSRLYSVELLTTFIALLYCSSIMGGLFGGRLTSYKTGVNFGVLLAGLGSLGLYFHQTYFLIFSLALLIVGYGLISPCVISIFGQNLQRGKHHAERSHSDFVLNYMSMNIGGVLGVGLSGLWGNPLQYRNNFLFGMLFLGVLFVLFNYVLSPSLLFLKQKKHQKWFQKIWPVFFLILVIVLVDRLLYAPFLADYFLIGVSILTVGYLLYLGKKLEKKEETFHFRGLLDFIFLTIVTVLFFILYNSEPDILTVFIEDHVNKAFMGFDIPSATYFMLNPFFNLIIGGLIFAGLKFSKKSFLPNIWIYSGIFFMGFGFWLLWVASVLNPNGNLSTAWVILIYAILSGAEMLLAPIAYEIVFIYGAPSLYGIMMGMCQLAIGLGALTTERLSHFIVPAPGTPALEGFHFFSHGFKMIGTIWMCLGIILLVATLLWQVFFQSEQKN